MPYIALFLFIFLCPLIFLIIFQAVRLDLRKKFCIRCWWESPGCIPSPAASAEVDVDKRRGGGLTQGRGGDPSALWHEPASPLEVSK